MSRFPEDPRRRRVVMVLEQHDIDKMHQDGETAIFADPHAQVITTLETAGPADTALAGIIDSGLDHPGTLLVQSPFQTDVYAEGGQAAEQFALTKQTLFLNFCQLLGATRVSVTQVTTVDGDKADTLDLEGGRFGASGSLSGKRTESEKLAARLSLLDEFEGGPPDIESAEALLRDNRLMGDQVMRSMLQARAGRNGIKRRTVTLNLSSETKNSLGVLAKLQIAPAHVSCDFKRIANERRTYELHMEVLFEPSHLVSAEAAA